MSYGLSTPIREAELSVKATAALVRKYGPTITLGDLHNRTDDELLRGGITRRGLKELREVIEYAKAQENPPAGGSNVLPPPTSIEFETPTLRDQFAMAALTGLLARGEMVVYEHLVVDVYAVADAMMEARRK